MRGLEARLAEKARAEGFDRIGITSADNGGAGDRLKDFIALGRHGTMGWMAETAARRADPAVLWPGAQSAIMLAMNYGPEFDPMARLERRGEGVISVYALNRDYHEVIKGRLKHVAQWLARETKEDVKVFVDTAPLMEKPLAAKAGLGWQGKHTNLVSRELGSWFFLGALLSAAKLVPDAPERDHCGTCQACLDICPTNAFPAPYQLDARRCISYLTIEHPGHIPREFRQAMGNRIYGCDDCLAVCPWNKFAASAREAKLKARDDLVAPALGDLLRLDDAAFRKLFAGSPVKRIGRDRFIRNVLIAAGNAGDRRLAGTITPLLADPSPLVRAMAVWALARLLDHNAFLHATQRAMAKEQDDSVQAEWLHAAR
jgi:epoxyqueuosine reductase